MPDEEDLSLPPGLEFEDAPRKPQTQSTKPITCSAPADDGARFEPRGVGDVYLKAPVGCVVEILKRAPVGNGKWQIIPPFTPKQEGERWAFAIMSAATSTTIKRGTRDVPAREDHPQFKEFNTCEPEKAAILRCRLVHVHFEEAYQFHLGAFQPPKGHGDTPPSGWWCRGDASQAERWVNGAFKRILCPGELCEFCQEKWGIGGKSAHCKPNLRLIAQFNWNEKSNFPRMMFQFDSKSWNNHGAIMGLFEFVKGIAKEVLKVEHFPVIQMPFTMTVKEVVKRNGRRYPAIAVSFEGDPYEWMGKVHQLLVAGREMPTLEGPAMRELPTSGMTQDDVDRAAEARLNPTYRPANER